MLSAYVHCRTGSFMSLKTIPFDIVAELDSEAARHEYMAQVLVDGDGEEILRALGHVAQALDSTPLNIDKVSSLVPCRHRAEKPSQG